MGSGHSTPQSIHRLCWKSKYRYFQKFFKYPNRKGGCRARGQNPDPIAWVPHSKACGITCLSTFRFLYSGCLRNLAPHHIQNYTKPVNMQAVMSKSFVGQSLRAAVPTAGQVWIPVKFLSHTCCAGLCAPGAR